jgi:hypothetical protein
MKHIDPDILAALQAVAGDEESKRLLNVKARHEKQAEQRFHTQLELMRDEVERVVPRGHPLFDLVLILAVARKMEHMQQEIERKRQEIEFPSASFPNGW